MELKFTPVVVYEMTGFRDASIHVNLSFQIKVKNLDLHYSSFMDEKSYRLLIFDLMLNFDTFDILILGHHADFIVHPLVC